MYPFWILLELRMMEVVVTTGAIVQTSNQTSPPTNQHPVFYRLDALAVVAQPTVSRALKRKQYLKKT